MSMVRLWRDQGKCNEARDLLTPIYNWFTETLTCDLKEAKALLGALASWPAWFVARRDSFPRQMNSVPIGANRT